MAAAFSEALQPPHPPPRVVMLGVSLAQGCALLWLWRAANEGFWPIQVPMLNFPLWAVALVWPALLLLSLDVRNLGRTLAMASAFAAVVAVLAAYLGWQASPFGEFFVFSLLVSTIASLLIACFKALVFLQPWATRQRATYDVLFALSWRNFLVVALAALATVIFYLVLVLWGRLFSAIGVRFFQDLFATDWFLFPVLAVAFGLGVQVFRALVHLIDGIAGLLAGLLRLLLPLGVAVQVAFLAALPFTGLAPLWSTGNGTLLLLCLSGLVLFGVNAVFQTGRDRPYPDLVHRFLYGGIALLPAITALAAYGLYLRVDQVGWSVNRLWAALVCILFALLSLGYAWHIARKRDAWLRGLGGVNTVMGWLVLAVMLLVNSPLLDFRSISLASQWRRVESGEIALRSFDFRYAKSDLARPGWLKTQALLEEHEATDPALARTIRNPYGAPLPAVDWPRLHRRPATVDVPPGARREVDRAINDQLSWHLSQAAHAGLRDAATPKTWIGTDLDADGEPDYVLAWAGSDYVAAIHVSRSGDGAWQTAMLAPRHLAPPAADAEALLRDGEIRTVERTVRDLAIGELILSRQPGGEALN